MAEKTLWKYLRNKMKDRWDACRHEDSVTIGVPDVSFAIDGKDGWIELKAMDHWPKTSTFQIPSLTLEQRAWIRNRSKHGGNCWILLRIERDYALIPGRNVSRIGIEPFRNLITALWIRSIDWDEFASIIARGRTS